MGGDGGVCSSLSQGANHDREDQQRKGLRNVGTPGFSSEGPHGNFENLFPSDFEHSEEDDPFGFQNLGLDNEVVAQSAPPNHEDHIQETAKTGNSECSISVSDFAQIGNSNCTILFRSDDNIFKRTGTMISEVWWVIKGHRVGGAQTIYEWVLPKTELHMSKIMI